MSQNPFKTWGGGDRPIEEFRLVRMNTWESKEQYKCFLAKSSYGNKFEHHCK
jgi:hypothetical protein